MKEFSKYLTFLFFSIVFITTVSIPSKVYTKNYSINECRLLLSSKNEPTIEKGLFVYYARLNRTVALKHVKLLVPFLNKRDWKYYSLKTAGFLFLKQDETKTGLRKYKLFDFNRIPKSKEYYYARNILSPHFERCLFEKHYSLRRKAVLTFAYMGYASESQINIIYKFLHDEHKYVRVASIRTIVNVAPHRAKTVKILRVLSNNKDLYVSEIARDALKYLSK